MTVLLHDVIKRRILRWAIILNFQVDTKILLRGRKPKRREGVVLQVLTTEGRGCEPRIVGVSEPSKGTSPPDSFILVLEIHFGLLASRAVKD